MPLKAGVVQFSPAYGRVEKNLSSLGRLVAEAAGQGAELVVLPEMAWTGYLWKDAASVRPVAETAGAGPGQRFLSELAQRLGVWVVYGFPERDGGRLYNSQGVAAPDGVERPVYRKTHLFEADEWWALPGDTGYRQWDSPWGRLGSGICMDLNFPDLAEFHRRRATAVLAFSTNWLDQDFDVVPYWQACLTEGGGFLGSALFANRGGAEYGVAYRGQSTVFVGGRPAGSLPGKTDGVLVVELPV